jgi:cytochrome c oxidase subunit III
MDFDRKKRVGTSRPSAFSRIEKIHPFMMMLYLSMMGIGVLFLMLVIAYVQSHAFDTEAWKLKFPRFFSVSTLIIISSSLAISKAIRCYKKDNLRKLKRYFLLSIFLSLAFIMAQVVSWYEISAAGITFTELAAGTYIYLISALHAVHLLGGLLFLTVTFFRTQHAASDAIRTLVFIRNPFVRQQIKMLTIYWHFMGAIWISLYLIFLFTLRS